MNEFLQVVPLPIAIFLVLFALFLTVLACLPTKGVEYLLAKFRSWRISGRI